MCQLGVVISNMLDFNPTCSYATCISNKKRIKKHIFWLRDGDSFRFDVRIGKSNRLVGVRILNANGWKSFNGYSRMCSVCEIFTEVVKYCCKDKNAITLWQTLDWMHTALIYHLKKKSFWKFSRSWRIILYKGSTTMMYCIESSQDMWTGISWQNCLVMSK